MGKCTNFHDSLVVNAFGEQELTMMYDCCGMRHAMFVGLPFTVTRDRKATFELFRWASAAASIELVFDDNDVSLMGGPAGSRVSRAVQADMWYLPLLVIGHL